MLTNFNPLGGLVGLVIVLVLIGLAMGALLNGGGIFNSATVLANADRITAETDVYTQQSEIRLRQLTAITEAETAAEVQRIQNWADAGEYLPYVLMGTGITVALILTTTFAICVLMSIRSRLAIQEAQAIRAQPVNIVTETRPEKNNSNNGHSRRITEETDFENLKVVHAKRREP